MHPVRRRNDQTARISLHHHQCQRAQKTKQTETPVNQRSRPPHLPDFRKPQGSTAASQPRHRRRSASVRRYLGNRKKTRKRKNDSRMEIPRNPLIRKDFTRAAAPPAPPGPQAAIPSKIPGSSSSQKAKIARAFNADPQPSLAKSARSRSPSRRRRNRRRSASR